MVPPPPASVNARRVSQPLDEAGEDLVAQQAAPGGQAGPAVGGGCREVVRYGPGDGVPELRRAQGVGAYAVVGPEAQDRRFGHGGRLREPFLAAWWQSAVLECSDVTLQA